MLVISNHVKTIGLDFPKDSIIRINVAWIKSLEELEKLLISYADYYVYLDYPTGRSKPPKPTIGMIEVIDIIEKHGNIKYFAFSNAEEVYQVQLIRRAVPDNVKLVPKIETLTGVKNLEQIVKAAETDIIMLDKEDLYTSCGNMPAVYNEKVDKVLKESKELKVNVLEMKGVIFHA